MRTFKIQVLNPLEKKVDESTVKADHFNVVDNAVFFFDENGNLIGFISAHLGALVQEEVTL